MKSLGLFFAISSTNEGPGGVDDDYDWHVRQAAVARASVTPARRTRGASIAERLGALARLFRLRSGEPNARRA